MNTFSVLNIFMCTCDTDANAKFDAIEMGYVQYFDGMYKCKNVQDWILGKNIQGQEFYYLDSNGDDFIDVQEFYAGIGPFGYMKTATTVKPD